MNFLDFVPTLPLLPNAACKDYEFPELFFPDSRAKEKRILPLAQSICAGCVERKECLAYALEQKIPHGIWAGTTPAMRGIKNESKRTAVKTNRAEKIRFLYQSGRTSKEIAEILGIGLSYVSTIVKRVDAKLEGENQSQLTKGRGKPSEESSSSSGFPQ